MKIIIIILGIFFTSISASFSQFTGIEHLDVIRNTKNSLIDFGIYDDDSFSHFINELEESQNSNFGISFSKLDSNQISNYLSQIIQRNGSNKFKIISLCFENCKIYKIPSLYRFPGLRAIKFEKMQNDVELTEFINYELAFGIIIKNCKFSQLPKNIEKLNYRLEIIIDASDSLTFDLNTELKKFIRKNNIYMFTFYGQDLSNFPESIFSLTQLQSLNFSIFSIAFCPDRFNDLINLKYIRLPFDESNYPKSVFQLDGNNGIMIIGKNFNTILRIKKNDKVSPSR